eukprot:CAMPEP_0176485842 /NCGR_PEP_ID=MMETSP0200_2-20121128/5254_1 /TAXON_ID=947934 /ORGANISM="Chaetoceros sp., Strain GSL56" /LENGTH=626 /DNA_ID=CAMNT_0017882511 /DNA_START=202 /DNA_END=2082 /DNA_ORIENTATION=+
MTQCTKPKSDQLQQPFLKRDSVIDKQALLFSKEEKAFKYCRMNSSASAASLQETSSSLDTMGRYSDNAYEHETRDDTGQLETCNHHRHHRTLPKLSSSSKLDDIGIQEEVCHHSDSDVCTKKRLQRQGNNGETYKSTRSTGATKIFLGVGVGVPMLAFLALFAQGISLLLSYRHFFGSKAPIPISPAHGVVAAMDRRRVFVGHDHDACGAETNDSNIGSCSAKDIDSGYLAVNELEDNYQFKTFVPSIHLSRSLQMAPLRLLVIGDSVARGVGQSNSFYPLMPETLGAILSKYHGGRPVFWSSFGEPGATMKWIASQVHRQTRTKDLTDKKVSMENFWKLHQHSNHDDDSNHDNDPSSSSSSSSKLQWIHKLQYHQQLYEANPFAGYDYIIALSGINDIKRMLVPFLVYDDDSSTHNGGNNETFPNRLKHLSKVLFTGHEWGFGGDLRRLVRDLHKLSDFHHNHDSLGQCHQSQNVKLPLIIFPSFPTRHVPAKTGFILRWIAIKLSGMLDAVKKRVADENTKYIFAAPFPDEQETLDFIHNVETPGSLRDMFGEDEVMIRLIHGNVHDCDRLVKDMKDFYSTRKAKQEDNMMASDLFSNDAVHPNDRGYDYFGRYSDEFHIRIYY